MDLKQSLAKLESLADALPAIMALAAPQEP